MDEAEKQAISGAFEKRLGRIERWLKRCARACQCGAWSSAMMEAECMEAEAREFRERLWSAALREVSGARAKPLKERIFSCVRVVSLSAVFVLAAGLPLSIDQDRPFYGFQAESVALLTSTEGEILSALRESLSNRNTGTVVLSIELPEAPVISDEPRPGVAAARTTPIPARAPAVKIVEKAPEPAPVPAQTGPTVEEVLSLIEVGQRALRVSEPAVRIVPATGDKVAAQ
jgi:hypothetical protein